MARKPKSPSTTKTETSNPFLDALAFINLITKEAGTINEVHSILRNKTITAHNGTIGAGHKIEEDIYAAPNNHLMLQALSKCGQDFSITQLEGNRLSIKSNKFKAIVPCADPNLFTGVIYTPDEPLYEINDTFREALQVVGVLASEAGQHIVTASILMANGTLIASDSKAIFEYWHGLQLPYGAAIPKSIVNPLIKAGKKLSRFGYSNSSITFWFDNDSWLKTQIMAEHWPDLKAILDVECKPWPLPPDFWKAVEAVAPFSPTGAVHFKPGMLASHPETGVGAVYEIAGLPSGPIFSAKLLELMRPHAQQVDFLVDGGRKLMFYGSKVRGAIAGMGQVDG